MIILAGALPAVAATPGSISGKITVPAGTDATQVRVDASPIAGSGSYQDMTVNAGADGSYTISGVSAGTYIVSFYGQPAGLAQQWFNGSGSAYTAQQVSLGDGQNVANVNAAMTVGGAITGTVSAPAGSDLTQISVAAVDVTNYSVSSAWVQVNSDGTYRLGGLNGDSYVLQFQSSIPSVASQWYGGHGRTSSPPVPVTLGQTVNGINANLVSAASITGTVTVPAGVDPTQTYVTAVPTQTSATAEYRYASVAPDGTYKITGLPAGSYNVQFQGGSTGATDQWYSNQPTQSGSQTFTLTAGQAVTGINATMLVGASVSGTVTVPTGVDPTQIKVGAFAASSGGTYSYGTAQVAADGSYKIIGLPEGSYAIEFMGGSSGAANQWYTNQPNQGTSQVLTLATRQAVTGINATMGLGTSASGSVSVPAGVDPTQVTVTAVPAAGSSTAGSASTQVTANGTYTIQGLPAGAYNIKFSSGSSGALTQWYSNQPNQSSSQTFTLTAGHPVTGVNATMALGASVSGTIIPPAGVDPTQIMVTAIPAQGSNTPENGYTWAHSDGTYKIQGLPAGAYNIEFSGGSSGALTQWYSNQPSQSTSQTFTLAAGQAVTGINATMALGATVSGTVTVPAGVDPTQTYVTAVPAQGSTTAGYGYAQVAADGTYKITGLPAGAYNIEFTAGSSGTLTQWYSNQPSQSTSQALTVAAGQAVTGINATMALGATVSGTVTVPAGVDPTRTYVTAVPAQGSATAGYGYAQVAADGTYKITGLPAGAYNIEFSGNDTGALTQWYSNQPDQSTSKALTLTTGQAVTGINATMALGATVSGTVTVPAGVDPTRTYVTAVPAQGSATTGYGHAQVAADGTYKITGLPAGAYNIEFSGNDSGALTQWYSNQPDQSTSQALTLTTGQAVTGINATMALGATVSGTVTVPTGINPTQISVMAVSPQGSSTAGYGYAGYATVGPDGTYKIVGLSPGTYNIEFSGNDSGALTQWYSNQPSQSTSKAVTLTIGQAVTGINATMLMGASISGTVTVPAGVNQRGIEVTAVPAQGSTSNSNGYAWVGSDGTYKIVGLSAGTYNIEFSGGYSGALDQWYSNQPSQGTSKALTLTTGQAVSGINATMALGGTVSGKVSSPAATAGYYDVQVIDSSGKTVKESGTSSDGTYSVQGLGTGTYKVAFNRASGYSTAEAQFYKGVPESTGIGAGTPVSVTAGQTTPNLNATLAAGGTISGTLLGTTGQPLANKQIQAYTTAGNLVTRDGSTDSNGNFSIGGLTTGHYLVKTTAYPNKPLYSGQVTTEAAAVPVSVTVGNETKIGSLSYAAVSATPSPTPTPTPSPTATPTPSPTATPTPSPTATPTPSPT
ncbi:carboxypeptidase-like regulatory domain-containing protein, partial [Arthrobacter sp. NPDC080031]|uniref:beta strand repeat-containing protein n=1 Tax=Arthrobacter sp. NPDC080031 TaxID=3155918 RepID=UPI00344B7BC0